MTPEERQTEDRSPGPADDEPGGLMAISPRVLDLMFPHPDTAGMTPGEAAAARARRDERVRVFIATAGGAVSTPRPAPPARPPAPPEVPVS